MRTLVTLATLGALLAAGCGGGEQQAEPAPPAPPAALPPATQPNPLPPPVPPPPPTFVSGPTFAKADLQRIVLRPSDAPAGFEFLPDESGPRTIQNPVLSLPSRARTLRRLGFQRAQDATFGTTAAARDDRVAERIWLFRNARSASAFLASTRDEAIDFQLTEISTPALGNESWAVEGLLQAGGFRVVTHAFRYGNAVFTVSMHALTTAISASAAHKVARMALARARAA